MKFNENRSKGSGDMERTMNMKCYGWADIRRAFLLPHHPPHGGGLIFSIEIVPIWTSSPELLDGYYIHVNYNKFTDVSC